MIVIEKQKKTREKDRVPNKEESNEHLLFSQNIPTRMFLQATKKLMLFELSLQVSFHDLAAHSLISQSTFTNLPL